MPEAERRIVLVRHAKAVPKDAAEDFERALADRGRHDAPRAGEWLAQSGVAVDLALCSSARRTRQTWQLMLAHWPTPPPTRYDDRLYDADADDLLDVVRESADDLTGLLLVGHNPAIHQLADGLCGGGPKDLVRVLRTSFPTSSVAVLTATGAWRDIARESAHLAELWTPGH
ncbi:histidine phosphatase family protein [Streptomyces sp. NPDC006326]|uniref:SixA phosphatase family protein n=1 Tax=Streptomyces sp. NPDC006326 TaxID=3156752 RepID=UPI0033B04433